MKIDKVKIQHHSNEFFLLRNYPEKRCICTDRQACTQSVGCDCNEYEQKLKACISAKTKIDNIQELENAYNLKGTWYWYTTKRRLDNPKLLEDGSIFDLPDNVEFEEKYQFYCMGWCDCSEKEYHAWNVRENVKADTQKVIHIKLKQEVKSLNNGIFTIITTPDSSSGKFGRSIPIGKRAPIKKVKEESQDGIISNLMDIIYNHLDWSDGEITGYRSDELEAALKSKFKIQRI